MAKKEYIERNALIDNTDDRYTLGEIGRMERDIIVNALKYAPAVDVRPIVRGKWERHNTSIDLCWHCSKCGTRYANTWTNEYNFCPNCGADMKEEN